jgi:Tol biopolymer transport system component
MWVLDLRRGSTTRLTFDGTHNNGAVWSPDGTRIVFAARPDGEPNVHHKLASGAGPEEPLLSAGPPRFPSDWSSDGRHILVEQVDQKTQSDLWMLAMPDRTAVPFLQSAFAERAGQFSPDAKWVAYVSNESGRDQVYVRAFPAASDVWPISIDGGVAPRWRADGKELFYVAANRTMMSATVALNPRFEAGRPQALFAVRLRNADGYAVSRDGQRFLLNPDAQESSAPAPPISVIVNWLAAKK